MCGRGHALARFLRFVASTWRVVARWGAHRLKGERRNAEGKVGGKGERPGELWTVPCRKTRSPPFWEYSISVMSKAICTNALGETMKAWELVPSLGVSCIIFETRCGVLVLSNWTTPRFCNRSRTSEVGWWNIDFDWVLSELELIVFAAVAEK